jgi:hypothetical protein
MLQQEMETRLPGAARLDYYRHDFDGEFGNSSTRGWSLRVDIRLRDFLNHFFGQPKLTAVEGTDCEMILFPEGLKMNMTPVPTTPTPVLTPNLQAIADKVNALLRLKTVSGFQTKNSIRSLLSPLSPTDLARVAQAIDATK